MKKNFLKVAFIGAMTVIASGLFTSCDKDEETPARSATELLAGIDDVSTTTAAQWTTWAAAQTFTDAEKENLQTYFGAGSGANWEKLTAEGKTFWTAKFAEWDVTGNNNENNTGNNNEGNTENNNESSSFDGSKIEATVSTGSTTVKIVKASTSDNEGEDYELASGTYANGRFTLTLPATVPEQCLETFEWEIERGLTISNPAAKYGGFQRIYAYNGAKEVGTFEYVQAGTNSSSGFNSIFMYVDSDVTVTGSYTSDDGDAFKYKNVSMKKGWNIFYGTRSYSEATKIYTYEYTTTAPSEMTWKFTAE